MSYFDKEVLSDLSKHNISFDVLTEIEHSSIVREINERIPFSGSKIAWTKLKNSINFSYNPLDLATSRLADEIRKVTDDNLIFVGDSACDEAYSIDPDFLEEALRIFSELPQHTYIVQKSLTWIACITFEGDLNFANLL